MWHLLEVHRYAPRLLSMPFALALVALLAVVAYGLVMRGTPLLRLSLLGWAASLVPYSGVCVLAASTPDPRVAEGLYRIGAAFVPLGAACSMTFQLALAGKLRARIPVIVAALVGGLAWLVAGIATHALVGGVYLLDSGMYFFSAGPLLPVGMVFILAFSAAGFVPLLAAYRGERDPLRRRRMGGVLWAMGLTWCGLSDVILAYRLGWFPLAWLFESAGLVFALRALFFDDLMRARAVDVRAPLILLYLTLGVLLGWLVAELFGPGLPAWLVGLAMCGAYLGLRVVIATAVATIRIGRRREGPLERLVQQFSARAGSLRSVEEIAAHTEDAVEVATGVRPFLIVPSPADWSWHRPDGTPLEEEATPDPLLLGWLIEHGGALLREDVELVPPADLRPALARLFEAHGAAAIVTLARRDEPVGVVMVPEEGGAFRAEQLRFIERIRDRVASALVYARMAGEAQSRVAIEREVELAAAVQTAFVPPAELRRAGALDVFGSWEPTSQCGGDWWALYELPDGRALIVIGDVTGHGVASAMVTAAAKGACDAAVALMKADVDLAALMARLDAAVRRIGAGRLHLTCFAALFDHGAGQVQFANAGHVVPYLCRDRGKPELELQALVARGNPLGAGAAPVTRSATRGLVGGDVVIWYTDGVVECLDPDGRQFGDRRMQRLLRKLDRERLDPESVHDAIAGAAAAHRSGRPINDDCTLVVARVRGEAPA
jgi:serine phosphatase RsbU (regulator of sigma subunit)